MKLQAYLSSQILFSPPLVKERGWLSRIQQFKPLLMERFLFECLTGKSTLWVFFPCTCNALIYSIFLNGNQAANVYALRHLCASSLHNWPVMCECVAHAQSSLVSLPPAGHRHVSVRRPLPVPLHVHGCSRRRLLCSRRLVVGAPTPLPERGAAPAPVQPLLPPHGGAGQHAAHHRSASHGCWRRRGAQGGRAGGGQSRPVRGYPGFHVGGDQPLVRDLLRLRVHVAQNVRGQGLRQRAAEYPTPGQRTRLESRQATERLTIGAHWTNCIFLLVLL